MTGLLVSLGVCLLIGALVDRALCDVPEAGPAERIGRALMWGLGTTGAVSMALDAAGVPVTATALGLALGVLSALLARPALQARARRPPAPRRTPLPPLARAAVVGLLLLAAVSVGQAVYSGLVRPTFQFDSLARWMFKAKVLSLEHTLRGPISIDPQFAFTHQRYPPLVSHVANLPALFTGTFDDRVAQSVFPWFAVALVLVLHGALRRRVGPVKAALGAAWVGSLPLLAYIPNPPPGAGAASAMADIPLGLFVTGVGLALLDAVEGRRDHAHLEAALLLGFATLTKNEGLPLVAGTALAVLLCAPRARVRRALGVAVPALVIFWSLWGALASGFPALDEDYPGRLGVGALAAGLSRLPVVLDGFAGEALSFRGWNLTWPLVVALLCCGRIPRAVAAVLVVLLVQLLAYVSAYMITPWNSPGAEIMAEDPVAYLITITVGRILMHVAPLAITAALLVAPPLLPRAGRTAAARAA